MPHPTTDAPPTPIQIPQALQVEHRAIHEALARATQAPGAIGIAARELAHVLHAHFEREEEIALPPLGLLAALARGELTPEMRAVLPMTDALAVELPRMLEEHRAVHAATHRLGDAARKAGDTAVMELAEALTLHAESEEQVFYPAALLVGQVVRGRSGVVAS